MRVDTYTKAVLTVIAISLTVIAAQPVVKSAFAQSSEIRKVSICAYDSEQSQIRCGRGNSENPLIVVVKKQ